MCCVSCSVVSDSLQPPWSPRNFCPRNFLGKNTGVGCHSHLQGIFLTQGSNPVLLQTGSFFSAWATRERYYWNNTKKKVRDLSQRICNLSLSCKVANAVFCTCIATKYTLAWKHTCNQYKIKVSKKKKKTTTQQCPGNYIVMQQFSLQCLLQFYYHNFNSSDQSISKDNQRYVLLHFNK